jgi:hypothetical protein
MFPDNVTCIANVLVGPTPNQLYFPTFFKKIQLVVSIRKKSTRAQQTFENKA